jgi:hypothetical protein
MLWFGENWGAPVCSEERQTVTPLRRRCQRCRQAIREGDRGFIIPGDYVLGLVWHLNCFVQCVTPQRGE